MNTLLHTLILCFASLYAGAFTLSAKNNVAIYWGQNSAGGQQRLSYYCQDDSIDIILLSFLTTFGKGQSLVVNFANACEGSYLSGYPSLLSCPSIGEDIKTCQAAGKAIILSLGGATGSYGFSDDADAKKVASDLHNIFGKGTSPNRVFGSASVDGFDFDIESGGPTGYGAFIDELRSLDSSYIVTGAPQCPKPDANLDASMQSSHYDILFVQFYNNYCGVSGSNFNYVDWEAYGQQHNTKIYLGVAASTGAANAGSFVDVSGLHSKIGSINSGNSFGGVMLWDASQSWANNLFHKQLKSLLGSSAPVDSNVVPPIDPNVVPPVKPNATLVSIPNTSPEPNIQDGPQTLTVVETSTVWVTMALPTAASTPSVRDKVVKPVDLPRSDFIVSTSTVLVYPNTTPTTDTACQDNEFKCDGSRIGHCDHGVWIFMTCPGTTVCVDGSFICDAPPKRTRRSVGHIARLRQARGRVRLVS